MSFLFMEKIDYAVVGAPFVGIPTINLAKPNLTGLEESSDNTVPFYYIIEILQKCYRIVKKILQSKKVLTNN